MLENAELPKLKSLCVRALVLGAASGLLSYLAFVDIEQLNPAGWLALVRLLLSMGSVACLAAVAASLGSGWTGWRRGIVIAACATVGQSWVWAVWQRWMFDVSGSGYFGVVPYLASYAGLFVLLSGWFISRGRDAAGRWRAVPVALGFIAAWGIVEHLRGNVVFSGYSFYLAGHSLLDLPWGWGAGRILGAGGSSALVGGAAACLGGALLLRQFRVIWGAIVCAGLLAISGVLGVLIDKTPDYLEDPVRFGVVQTNVAQSVRGGWDAEARLETLRSLQEQSSAAVADGAEVVVWPETMFPGADFDNASAAVWAERGIGIGLSSGEFLPLSLLRDETLLFTEELGVPFVIGARASRDLTITEDQQGIAIEADAVFNSVFAVEGREVGERYDKVRLTPFGEEIPYIGQIDWLESLVLSVGVGASGMSFDLERGEQARTVEVSGVGEVATPICFEATMAAHCADLVDAGGGILLNLTNDGWFGSSSNGRAAHLLSARWRAAELGRPMVRSANTGFSAIVDNRGAVTQWLGDQQAGFLVGEVSPVTGMRTGFQFAGRWWWGAFWLLGLTVGIGVLRTQSPTSVVRSDDPVAPDLEAD